jgi:glucose/mannose-6-phosphate isomerase
MLDDILAIPAHLRDALWRIESARLEPREAAGVLVCGMGGSAIGGDLAAAALGERLSAPLVTVRGYGLPSWVSEEWCVLCSSYSGETEETLSCFEGAESLGARRVIASTGGTLTERARGAGDPVIGLPGLLPAPRTAVAYMLVCALEVAAAAGIAPSIAAEVEAAAALLEAERDDLRHLAAEIAATLGERSPVLYGAGPTAAAARRWKTQVNENAKLPAFASELPEANHNEICAWEGAPAA